MKPRRREFPAEVKRQARQRSNGICECGRLPARARPGLDPGPKIGCGRPLGAGNTFYEHITPDGIGGKPTLENCAVLTKTCWAKKSPDDITVVAKAKRQNDRDIGIRRGNGARSLTHPYLRRKVDSTVERRI